MIWPSVNNRFEKPALPHRVAIFHAVKKTDNFMSKLTFRAAEYHANLKTIPIC